MANIIEIYVLPESFDGSAVRVLADGSAVRVLADASTTRELADNSSNSTD
jgi:hypothetical protein